MLVTIFLLFWSIDRLSPKVIKYVGVIMSLMFKIALLLHNKARNAININITLVKWSYLLPQRCYKMLSKYV